MNEPFRTRDVSDVTVEAPLEAQDAPQSTKQVISEDIPAGAKPLQDEPNLDEKQLEIWEGLNRTKYINEYFNIKAFEGEFNLKMQTSQINKYIKAELETRKWEKSVDNWSKIMNEIESEIGSKEMTTFERISKITSYIRVLNKLNEAKKLKEKYSNSTI